MDRRTLLAIFLCFMIFMGWQKFYLEPRMPRPTTATTAPTEGAAEQPRVSGAEGAAPGGTQAQHQQKHAPQSLNLSNSVGEAVLADGGYFLKDWALKSYRLGLAQEAAAVDMQSVTNRAGQLEFAFDIFPYLSNVQGDLAKTPTGAVWTYEDSNVKLVREFTSNAGQPYVDLKISAVFKTQQPKFAYLSVASEALPKDPEAHDRQLVYWSNGSIERVPMKDSVDAKEVATPIRYVGSTSRYFVLALVNQSPVEPRGLVQPLGTGAARMNLVYPITGSSIAIPARVYFGPKELGLLRSVEPTLDHVVDFGWFTVFAYPILKLLKWLFSFLRNYGVAIIVLTLLLKLVTYPLTYKSMKSMKEMARLQPQLAKLREKYKDDKEALNREMLTMMRSHGYNPMAGCLPMLIQMPIFFALYRVLYSSIELYHAPFGIWITDLSAKDPFYITPILLALTMFIQQRLTPSTTTDPAQQRMMQFMPLIFGAMMLTLPSGLTLYMLVNALAGIVQQMVLNKKLDKGGGPHGPPRVPVTA